MQSLPSNQAESKSRDASPEVIQPRNENNNHDAPENVNDLESVSVRATESGLPFPQFELSLPWPSSSSESLQSSRSHDRYLSRRQSGILSNSTRSGIYHALQQNDEPRSMLAGASWDESSAMTTLLQSRIATDGDDLIGDGNLGLTVENERWIDNGQSLPADDGMRILRQRIHAIREGGASNAEKAQQIHAIMTESYRSSLGVSGSPQPTLQRGATIQPHDRPWTPLSPRSKHSSDQLTLTPASTSSIASYTSGNPYYLSMDDLTPTYYPGTATLAQPYDHDDFVLSALAAGDLLDEEAQQILGCKHYKRNVKLQCFTCKKWYTCRFCHDDIEDHTLIRRKTENMLCMMCQTPQQANQWCKSCGTQAACYYCGICKLWDNDASKSIYHCHDCGICRRGEGLGKDFFHCKTCSVCLPIKIETSHRCIERATQCDCPICGEYMFTSPDPVIFMKCGHSIHQKCFDKYSKTSYRCPICNKTVANMEAHFRNLDRTIGSQPMPAEFRNTKAVINCNDCHAKSVVQYHWLGLKCDTCDSYNTSQIRLFSTNNDQNDEPVSRQGSGILISIPRIPNDLSVENRTIARSIPTADGSSDALGSIMGSGSRAIPALPQSYNARSVSPTVSNYFGLSRRRGSIWTTISQPEVIHSDSENDERGSFWPVSALKRATLGFLGSREYDSEEEKDDDEEQDDYEDEDPANDQEEELEDGEDDEDIDDIIDIFGHR
ncbi:CHY zinc finger domain-containing protein [Coccidioides immitis RS]|uniref:CHY zinc finger domain-containing protein n=1 Tax=Coccidioides immitis (strain RS) TaxID=246410 RepID=A0A0E1RX74_COCIM|nr:CHY zinc finger domain-containing protein [Coccidioides immitis RS]EAS31712.2 CHY zinc finger domain-containing protein [Coccidioides immitis RS]